MMSWSLKRRWSFRMLLVIQQHSKRSKLWYFLIFILTYFYLTTIKWFFFLHNLTSSQHLKDYFSKFWKIPLVLLGYRLCFYLNMTDENKEKCFWDMSELMWFRLCCSHMLNNHIFWLVSYYLSNEVAYLHFDLTVVLFISSSIRVCKMEGKFF